MILFLVFDAKLNIVMKNVINCTFLYFYIFERINKISKSKNLYNFKLKKTNNKFAITLKGF